jgi:hypothetical protein
MNVSGFLTVGCTKQAPGVPADSFCDPRQDDVRMTVVLNTGEARCSHFLLLVPLSTLSSLVPYSLDSGICDLYPGKTQLG